jgi:hypothetical protein
MQLHSGTMRDTVLRTIGDRTMSIAQILVRLSRIRKIGYASEWRDEVLELAESGVLARTWDNNGTPLYTKA